MGVHVLGFRHAESSTRELSSISVKFISQAGIRSKSCIGQTVYMVCTFETLSAGCVGLCFSRACVVEESIFSL